MTGIILTIRLDMLFFKFQKVLILSPIQIQIISCYTTTTLNLFNEWLVLFVKQWLCHSNLLSFSKHIALNTLVLIITIMSSLILLNILQIIFELFDSIIHFFILLNPLEIAVPLALHLLLKVLSFWCSCWLHFCNLLLVLVFKISLAIQMFLNILL